MRFCTRNRLLLLIIIGLLAAPRIVAACGEFFGPPDASVYINTLRVIYAVDKPQGTITEIVGINYTGTPADFGWIMPLPATPTVSVAKSGLLDSLEEATAVNMISPVNDCAGMMPLSEGSGGGGPPSGIQGEVGPYDYALIKGEQPDQLIGWLRDKGYKILKTDEALIGQYIREGNMFIALHLKPGAEVQDIQPIVLTYKSDKVVIPVRMGAASSSDTVSILAWIFADTQYAPANYASLPLTSVMPYLTSARGRNEVINMGAYDVGPSTEVYDNERDAYNGALTGLQAKYGGHVFVTEYAKPTTAPSVSIDNFTDEPLLTGFFSHYMYLTRLSGRLSARQMTLDPVFVPVPTALNESSSLAFDEVVDPLTFWGCTTPAALSPTVRQEFANSHTVFPDLRFDVGYPANWVLSKFTVNAPELNPIRAGRDTSTPAPITHLQQVYVYAPQPVDEKILDSFFTGAKTPPMFVFTQLSEPTWQAWSDVYDDLDYSPYDEHSGCQIFSGGVIGTLVKSLGVTHCQNKDSLAIDSHVSMAPLRIGQPIDGVFFAMLTSSDDSRKNNTLYYNMRTYAQAHLHYLRPDVQDTLFLKVVIDQDNAPPDIFTLPIPDGWVAHTEAGNDIVIAPVNDGSMGGDTPAMRLTPIEKNNFYIGGFNAPFANQTRDADLQVKVKRLTALYGLTLNEPDIETALSTCPADPGVAAAIPFSANGRAGQVLLTNEYVVSISAPQSALVANQATLQMMLDAFQDGYRCGKAATRPPLKVTLAPGQVCIGSAVSRLAVGQTGHTLPGDPTRMRATPALNAKVSGSLPAGTTFTVSAGPTCDPDAELTWWQITSGGLTGWLAESSGKTYYVAPGGTAS